MASHHVGLTTSPAFTTYNICRVPTRVFRREFRNLGS